MSSNLHRRVLEHSSATCGIGLPPRGPSAFGNLNIRSKRRRDFSAVSWDKYFSSRDVVETKEGKNSFVIYEKASEVNADIDKCKLPVIFLLHGGGFSALTWSLLVADITTRVRCRAVAVDLRGHGETVTEDDGDLSAESMASDVVNLTQRITGSTELSMLPPVVLVGHSMGGALAVHAALSGQIDNLVGLCILDVVEGKALSNSNIKSKQIQIDYFNIILSRDSEHLNICDCHTSPLILINVKEALEVEILSIYFRNGNGCFVEHAVFSPQPPVSV